MRWRSLPDGHRDANYYAKREPNALLSAPQPYCDMSNNYVVATLLGPNGQPIRQLMAKSPIGYKRDSER